MTDSRAALGSDRLPWLSDEPKGKPAPRKPVLPNLWVSAAGVLLLVAGASYWLGTRTGNDGPAKPEVTRSVVTPLPEARTVAPQEVEPVAQQQVSPVPAPEVRTPRERGFRSEKSRPVERIVIQNPEAPSEAPESSSVAPTAPVAAPIVNPDSKPLRAWPAWESAGAKGRIVRIGAFGTREQAKLGWRHMVQAYPAVAHLKATVVTDRNSRGRYFYRFQLGTTSQAHSEVLCQRMERIRFSCAVVGLPWKPKGVER
ncbi:MAG TPA: hypothetical protein VG434_07000 [Sphingomicrobium sp.]|nr:hypothetical protein [Sphingomicrobium sp.]